MSKCAVLIAVLCLRQAACPAETPDGRAPKTAAVRAPGTLNLLVLGDSLGAGYGVEPGEAWPALLQTNFQYAGLPVLVVNASVSGDTTAGGLSRLDWQLRRPVDVLVLELGGNDGLRGVPPAVTRSNLTAIIRRTVARNPGVQVVVAGLQMPGNMGPEFAAEFAEVFPAVAREERATLIPGLLAGVGGVAELNQADQIHPTATGHRRVASNVWVVLEPVVRARLESR